LGLSDAEFLGETPYSLTLMIRRLEMQEFKNARGHALTASILANVNRDTKKRPEPFGELDFIPRHLIPQNLRKSRKLSYSELPPEKQRAALAAFFGHSVRNGRIVPRKPKRKKQK
jgi:hypothetical protein